MENLKPIRSVDIYQGAVWTNINRRGIDSSDVRRAVRLQVTFQACAVINNTEDDSQYLLVTGVDCGIDYQDASQDKGGTEAAEELRGKLLDYCTEKGLKIRPGVVSE